MTTYKPGDRVDITIKGARVVNTYGTGRKPANGPTEDTGTVLVFVMDGALYKDTSHTVNMGDPGVTVERRDRDGDVWQVCMIGDGEVSTLTMICAAGAADRSPEQLLTKFGPLTFVRREDEQDGDRRG